MLTRNTSGAFDRVIHARLTNQCNYMKEHHHIGSKTINSCILVIMLLLSGCTSTLTDFNKYRDPNMTKEAACKILEQCYYYIPNTEYFDYTGSVTESDLVFSSCSATYTDSSNTSIVGNKLVTRLRYHTERINCDEVIKWSDVYKIRLYQELFNYYGSSTFIYRIYEIKLYSKDGKPLVNIVPSDKTNLVLTPEEKTEYNRLQLDRKISEWHCPKHVIPDLGKLTVAAIIALCPNVEHP